MPKPLSITLVLFAIGPAGLLGCASDERAPPVGPGPGARLPVAAVASAARTDDDDDIEPTITERVLDSFPLDGHLAGRIGPIAVDATPYRMDASFSPGHVHFTLFAEGLGGEGMIAVDIRGGLDHVDFARGVPVLFEGVEPTDPAALWVNVLGCSGLRAPDWDYDAPATRVSVRVRPSLDDEQLEIEVEAQFGGTSQARGSVTLAR